MEGLHALIMAGGSGTRFWPLSREQWPKQMLDIVGEGTMISQTFNRLKGLVADKNIHILTTSMQAGDIRLHLDPHRKKDISIFTEPCPRNTAPAIGLAAIRLNKIDPASTMIVLPADHYISDIKPFLNTIRKAVGAAKKGNLVTIGIIPSRPDTGYGYIKRGKTINTGIFAVECFVEKPNRERAEGYLQDGGYYWNSGIFIWKTSAILKEVKSKMPSLYKGLKKIEKTIGSKREEEVIEEVYTKFEKISIDYGVMEKSDTVLMVAAEFPWSDLGSWPALDDVLEKDPEGNIIKGNCFDLGSKDSIIIADKRFVATLGLKDIVVVDTPDAMLVCPKEKSQEIRKVVGELKKRGREEHILHLTVERPWGSYTVLEKGKGYKIKRIYIRPNGKLSLQMHKRRSEHWVVVSGTARVTKDKKIFDLHTNESTFIPISVVHRLENPGAEPVQIIEVQNGAYLGEDDIIRLEDVYDR